MCVYFDFFFLFFFLLLLKAQEQLWLSNPSYQLPPSTSTMEIDDNDIEIKDCDVERDSSNDSSKPIKKHSKKKKKKLHKHHKEKHSKIEKIDDTTTKSEFTGKEDYYVDKQPDNSLLTLTKASMKKKDCTRYHVNVKLLGTLPSMQQTKLLRHSSKDKLKRYFHIKSRKAEKIKSETINDDAGAATAVNEVSKAHRLTEDEFTEKTKLFNRSLLTTDISNIDMWLDFVRLQENFYAKITKLQLAERKMEILNKALRDNLGNDRLYHEYVDILEQTYPSFEVSKYLDILIAKGNNHNKFYIVITFQRKGVRHSVVILVLIVVRCCFQQIQPILSYGMHR